MFTETCPFQIDLCPWIDHPCSHGKSIDVGYHAIDRIIRQITQFLLFAHRCCQCTHQKLRLIHAGIISTDRRIRHINRAVKNSQLWILDGRLDTACRHLWSHGKDHIASLSHRRIDSLQKHLFGIHILIRSSLHPPSKALLQIHPSQFMSINPARTLLTLQIDESGL